MDPVPVRTTEYEISGAEAVEQFLIEAYGTSMRIHGGSDRRLLRHRRIDAGAFAVETIYQSGEVSFAVEPLHSIVVVRTSTARLELSAAGGDRRYGTGELFVVADPDRPYTSRWIPGEIHGCVIDPAALARVATSAPDRRSQPIRFTGLDPVTPAMAAHWQATRSYVAGLLADPVASASPLLVASASDLIAAVTLTAFPNTALADPTIEDRRDAHPDTLRRAVAFIDEHAHLGITSADIAAAAHVSIRAVQLAFRRHLGMTPLEYLRLVRLDHAHADLLAADPATTTITAVAYRWGFPSASRFTVYYRQAYGIQPSTTLRRG